MGTRCEAVLTSTHNLCFVAKIRKCVYPSKPHFFSIKVGCKGVFVTRTCYPDVDTHFHIVKPAAVLTSTHTLCFRAKIRKNEYPCKPQFYYIKVGCKEVYIIRTCLHDVLSVLYMANSFFSHTD